MSYLSLIDARDIRCPAPFIKTERAMAKTDIGSIIRLESNDPFFPADCESWCKRSGHELLQLDHSGDIHAALIRRGI